MPEHVLCLLDWLPDDFNDYYESHVKKATTAKRAPRMGGDYSRKVNPDYGSVYHAMDNRPWNLKTEALQNQVIYVSATQPIMS
jgi:excinuclease UvrABC helicase subunit UvrB